MSGFSNTQQQQIYETIFDMLSSLSFSTVMTCMVEETPDVSLPDFERRDVRTPETTLGAKGAIFLRSIATPATAPLVDQSELPPKDERRKLLAWLLFAAQYNYATRTVQVPPAPKEMLVVNVLPVDCPSGCWSTS